MVTLCELSLTMAYTLHKAHVFMVTSSSIENHFDKARVRFEFDLDLVQPVHLNIF